ncbi:MAG: peptidylprolyl isomerase [Gemmatimonadaceae bacterium]
MKHYLSFGALLAATVLTACESKNEEEAPDACAAATTVPDSFQVVFETGKGRFVVAVDRTWAPLGAARFHELVRTHYYDGVKFFRVLPDFMAQFGIHGDPATNAQWTNNAIQDDPVRQSNTKGAVTFATAGPNTRTTQLFINTQDNPRLDQMGFAPMGRVVEGLDVVEKLYNGYGEGAPNGAGPSQGLIERDGNRYLNRYFPRLDSIVTARIKC